MFPTLFAISVPRPRGAIRKVWIATGVDAHYEQKTALLLLGSASVAGSSS
jgi:hypothetical protein